VILEVVFWCSVGLVLYAYAGYPLALLALSLVRNRRVKKTPANPPVSFIITAHNEELRIRQKLENTVGQKYPPERLEVIVASDCSTDRTDDIARAFAPRVRLVRAETRRGKEAAQQLAIDAASGDVLIFSDVATVLAPDGVATIVANFSDPTVGCVSSIDRVVEPDGQVSGEGLYVRYEMFLRRLETAVNSLVGLSGSFFAARREVCRRWAVDRQSDFSTLLNTIEIGLRGVLDPQSVGYYQGLANERREHQRKVRTIVRGLSVLSANFHMLNPLRYGLFAWQLLSHKLCRWLVPFAMIAAALSNALLAPVSTVYLALCFAQFAFYALAVAGCRTGAAILRIPAFLLVSNAAVLTAWLRYLRGDRMTTWKPSERLATLPHTTCH
jgi:glycosyltransferase involved in cell wall biosynthesis